MLPLIRQKISLFSVLAGLLFFLPDLASAQNVLRIAAVVNDDVITADDLAQRIRLTIATTRLPNTPEVRKRLTNNVLRTMIDERLKVQEAKRLDIELTDQKIESGLVNFAKVIKVPRDKLPQVLGQIGVDIETIEDQAEAEIAWARAVTRQGRDRIQVSEKEISTALAEIEANKGKPEYLYSEIYLPIETPSMEQAARQLAERLTGHIENGSPFTALARDFSKSPSSVRGGDLGWVQSGNIAKEIEAVLSRLPNGSYSQPIQTGSGIYLIHLRDKRVSGQEEHDEILTVSQVIFPYGENPSPDQINARRGAARSLAQQARSCQHLDELGKQIGSAQSGQVSNVKLSSMPPSVRNALAPSPVGQVTIAEQNNAVLVLMVCERQQVAAVPEVTKRKNIRQRLRTEKIGRESRRLLSKLRRSAFVDIRL